MKRDHYKLIIVVLAIANFIFFQKGKSQKEHIQRLEIVQTQLQQELKIKEDIIKNTQTDKNVKTVITIKPDGEKRIEKTDLTKVKQNETSQTDLGLKLNLNQNTVKQEDIKKSSSNTLLTIGVGLDNNIKPTGHLIYQKNRYSSGAHINNDGSTYGLWIGVGF